MKNFLCIFALLVTIHPLVAQELEPIQIDDQWLSTIAELAPSTPQVKPKDARNVLVFSLHTGYEHWVIPHTSAIVSIIAEKSEAFSVTESMDIKVFEEEGLAKFDAVILNNTCSKPEMRNLFWDELGEGKKISKTKRKKSAKRLEQNLLDYVQNGGGLIVLHGGITILNKSEAFSAMVGGSFDYHPPQQEVTVNLVDTDHPIVAPFEGRPFVHIDEPYFYNNAYSDYNFRPLLSMNAESVNSLREMPQDKTRYISWVKKYGEGRVFVCSPSHNAQSFENPILLEFLLNGIQYATGDLACDDSPLLKP